MIRTLAWKEYREHQTVWVAMAALATLVVVGMAQVVAPNGVASAPQPKVITLAFAALLMAGTYGLVCGAMMVAGERESRTLGFLDTLPAGRTRVWLTKLSSGLVFTLAQALVVVVLVTTQG